MRGGDSIHQRLVVFFALGVLLLTFPFLAVFNRPVWVGGIPLLYVYLFAVWLLGIAALALLSRVRWDDQE